MSDRIILGKKGDEHGLWVSRPGTSVETGGDYLMSSVSDMLKIHAQGSVSSTATNQSAGLWRHNLEVPFPELPYIPLAFMALKTGEAEPFHYPPNLNSSISVSFFSQAGYVSHLPKIGIAHNALYYVGWAPQQYCFFNYTVFLTKIREKF